MSFGIPVRNGLGVGLISYASLASRKPGGGWTPAQISTALWLDAADSSTITLNGATVSQWNDKSGNGRNVSQATAAAQPDYLSSGINGYPALDWGAAQNSKFLNASGLTGYSPQRYFGVADYDGPNPFDVFSGIVTHSFVSNNDLFRTSATGTLWGDGQFAFLNGATTSSQTALPTISSPFIFSNDFAQAANRPAVWIGSDRAVALRSWRGKLGEIISLGFIPTTDIKQKIEGYLAWKWGGF